MEKLTKLFDIQISQPDEISQKQFVFEITNNKLDRDSDTVNISGVDLSNFMKNPVVLFNHDRSKLVGKAKNLNVESGRITAEIEFPEKGISPMADEVAGMVEAGFLNAVSIGFAVKEWSFDEESDGFKFDETELLEISLVTIPANASALRITRSLESKRHKKLKKLRVLKLKGEL